MIIQMFSHKGNNKSPLDINDAQEEFEIAWRGKKKKRNSMEK